MKHKLSLLASLTTLALAAFNARATIVLQDNFNYPDGALMDVAGGVWGPEISNTNAGTVKVVSNQAFISTNFPGEFTMSFFTNGDGFFPLSYTTNGQTFFSNNPVGYFPSNSPNVALYSSFTINLPAPRLGNSYFAALADTNFHFRCRIAIVTNGAAYRIGVAGGGLSSPTNVVQQQLSYGTPYTIVSRYVLRSGLSTVWIAPNSETNTDITVSTNASDNPGTGGITTINGKTTNASTCAFMIRNGNATVTNLYLYNLVVGTTFADVVPGSVNPPFVLTQPKDAGTFIVGNSNTFSILAVGDPALTYQWYHNTNSPVSDATNAALTLTNLQLTDSGTYSCVVTNPSGVTTTRFASLTVILQPIRVTITNQPQSQTVNVGDSATFNVVAGGVPAPTYQWKFVSGGVTNVITNATSPTLSFDNLSTNQAGQYFVSITNTFPSSTNSDLATLTVNPPQLLNLSTIRTYEDTNTWAPTNLTSVYVAEGIVTTWTNLTTSGNTEFFMQDSTAGIAVFWAGADSSTNVPPAGARVRVTAPLAAFNGLLELEPVFTNSLHSVVVISTNNPLPIPQPLPFDPNVVNDTPTMERLEGSYFVASNVFLYLQTPNFAANANDPMTNALDHVLTAPMFGITFTNTAGQTFTFFVNSHTDIAGQPKPTGPVTIFGVLGQFISSMPFIGGYEFTPTRLADIVTYVNWTNVLRNVTRLGDLLTNSYTESVLRPGENLTMDVAITDPAGAGSVTLGPSSVGLPATAYWTNVNNGVTARAQLYFQPAPADAGSNYLIALGWTTTTGAATNYWKIYVPNAAEQQVYVTEVLARPATDPASRAFNPLNRASDTGNIAVNDQYIEVANLSGSNIDLINWTVGDASTVRHTFFNGAPTEQLNSSNAVVVYGGPLNGGSSPNLPVLSFPANPGPLALSSAGGVVALHNGDRHLVDRINYPASPVAGSLSRFPTLGSTMVPQPYVSTNFVTPGLQYDGGAWDLPTKVPAGVTNVVVSSGTVTVTNITGTVTNVSLQQVIKLSFTADTALASTLWKANEITGTFGVTFGQQFTNSAAMFFLTNPPPNYQFYFITTQ